MLKLSIDYEFASRTWWDGGGQALWEAIAQDGGGSVVLDEHVARSWLEGASRIPGWDDGHEFAPHPIAVGDWDPEQDS